MATSHSTTNGQTAPHPVWINIAKLIVVYYNVDIRGNKNQMRERQASVMLDQDDRPIEWAILANSVC